MEEIQIEWWLEKLEFYIKDLFRDGWKKNLNSNLD